MQQTKNSLLIGVPRHGDVHILSFVFLAKKIHIKPYKIITSDVRFQAALIQLGRKGATILVLMSENNTQTLNCLYTCSLYSFLASTQRFEGKGRKAGSTGDAFSMAVQLFQRKRKDPLVDSLYTHIWDPHHWVPRATLQVIIGKSLFYRTVRPTSMSLCDRKS